MRKQDRIARDHEQNESEHHVEPASRPQERDQIKGSASSGEPPKPRPSGKLPLPD